MSEINTAKLTVKLINTNLQCDKQINSIIRWIDGLECVPHHFSRMQQHSGQKILHQHVNMYQSIRRKLQPLHTTCCFSQWQLSSSVESSSMSERIIGHIILEYRSCLCIDVVQIWGLVAGLISAQFYYFKN
jgi:hypothetical protein